MFFTCGVTTNDWDKCSLLEPQINLFHASKKGEMGAKWNKVLIQGIGVGDMYPLEENSKTKIFTYL